MILRVISFGLCVGLERTGLHVGLRHTSWGFHGDNGLFYHGSGTDLQMETLPTDHMHVRATYGMGDIVGCGLDREGTLFFTKNGDKIIGRFG